MTLFQRQLAGKIRDYAKRKGLRNDHYQYNADKAEFFKCLANLMDNEQLSVAKLNEKLAEYGGNNKRTNLFYFRRTGRASASCEAAQWLTKIYHLLNIPLSESDIANLVAHGLDSVTQERLNNYPYRYWQQYPYSLLAKEHLDQELKVLLNLPNAAGLPLAEALNNSLDAGELNVVEVLQSLEKSAPHYLPEVINDVYQLVESEKKAKDDFIKILITALDGSQKPLFALIASANVEISTQLIDAYPQYFSSLSPSMQTAVFSRLQEKTIDSLLNGVIELDDSRREDLIGYIYNELFSEKTTWEQLDRDQAVEAIKLINAYLRTDPNEFKTNFYLDLKAAIQQKGLSLSLLEKHLKNNKLELFESIWGPDQSKAAQLMVDLVNLANYFPLDSSHQNPVSVTRILNFPKLPRFKGTQERKENKLLTITGAIVYHPEQARKSELGHSIGRYLLPYQTRTNLLQKSQEMQQKRAEAIYQGYLVKLGLDRGSKLDNPIFDPQGHLLVRVHLEESDFLEIIGLIQGDQQGQKKQQELEGLEGLEALLGRKITSTTFCNLDVGANEVGKRFENLLAEDHALDTELVNKYMESKERSSVIALQEELMLHVSLSLRAMDKIVQPLSEPVRESDKKGKEKGKEKEGQLTEKTTSSLLDSDQYNALMVKINNAVLFQFAKSLKEASQDGKIDYVQLNKKLDEARKELAPSCRKLLVDAIKKTGNELAINIIKTNFATDQIKEERFTSTTATGIDYLRTDSINETIVRISATDETSHNKKTGAAKQAIRYLARNRYHLHEGEYSVTPYATATVEARVPSIADISVSHAVAVADVESKLDYSQAKLRQQAGGYQGPIIYNLLTSLHSKLWDNSFFESRNKQRTSAARILKGAHRYNAARYHRLNDAQGLIYVQNIPVNQHTNELDMKSSDGATAEAALMTHVAILATLSHYAALFPPQLGWDLNNTFEVIRGRYLDFLPQGLEGTRYFKDSEAGKQSIRILIAKKAQWQEISLKPAKGDLYTLAAQALFKLMIHDDHQNKQFGMLSQAIAVFLEPVSQAGCKSANERYQGVAGRVELLKGLCERDREELSKEQTALIDTLVEFVEGKSEAADLQQSLDQAYDANNLQGSAAAISEEDQGASSKVRASTSKGGRLSATEINTNVAESGFLTRLSQKFADLMQAHKANLPEAFRRLFLDKPVLSEDSTHSNRF